MGERRKLVKGKQARFVFAAAAKRPASVSGGGGGRAGQAGPVRLIRCASKFRGGLTAGMGLRNIHERPP